MTSWGDDFTKYKERSGGDRNKLDVLHFGE